MKIIGQENLINEVERIIKIFIKSNCMIKPHFILTGPSGSGKTITIRQLSQKHKARYFEINAAQLTKEGTSGNSLSKALSPLLVNTSIPTIIFVDEFDKLFISGNCNTDLAHESTNGVQNEFLDILEGQTTAVFGDYGKYINVSVSNILFVFAGAFNGEEEVTIDKLRSFGIKTEFLGRVGLVYHTVPLTIDNLFEILDKSELLNHYLNLFTDVDRETVILQLKGYLQKNHEMNTLGARMINTLINQYFIKGGLPEKEVKKITFQEKIPFTDNKKPNIPMLPNENF